MNIFEELITTERIVQRAEADYIRPFKAEARSSIRERALRQMALEADRQTTRATELDERPLSPGLKALQAWGHPPRQGALERYRQQIEAVRAQDAAADADEKAFSKLTPLQQSKMRDGWYRRRVIDPEAAIAGLLRRERRSSSPLTRESFGRAKSIDAARRRDPFVVTDADLEAAARGPLSSADLRAYQIVQANRRETLFAQRKVIAGGYPGPRGSSIASVLAKGCFDGSN